MKLVVLFIASYVLCASAESSDLAEWNKWKSEHSKSYFSAEEEQHRMKIWLANKRRVDAHNAKYAKGLTTYTQRLNHLGDLTKIEKQQHLGLKTGSMPKSSGKRSKFMPNSKFTAPDSKDWRKEGAVNPVKDQGSCGSCWAFSTIASIETQYFLKHEKLASFSEQQLVDCSKGNNGCEGGLMDEAFDYLKHHSLATEDSYPYVALDEDCKFKAIGQTVESYTDLPMRDEDALKEAVASVGVVSVAIAANDNFMDYHQGIFDDPTCADDPLQLNHGVAVVGYGSEDGKDFWIVRNSWSSAYGEEGYIRMSRNKEDQCGIALKASYPQLYN